jgi:hypothetical protein
MLHTAEAADGNAPRKRSLGARVADFEPLTKSLLVRKLRTDIDGSDTGAMASIRCKRGVTDMKVEESNKETQSQKQLFFSQQPFESVFRGNL